MFDLSEPIVNLLGTYGFGGMVIVLGALALIKRWADTNKDKAKDDAEASLYQNLSSENSRMSAMLVTMTTQLNILLKDNSALLSRVTALEASVKDLSVWETRALALQALVAERDKTIVELNSRIVQQELLIAKINTAIL